MKSYILVNQVSRRVPPLDVILILVGIGLFIALILGVGSYLEKKRTSAFEITAGQMGLEFLSGGDDGLQTRLSVMKLFNQGRARKIRNLVVGDAGDIRIAIFDYQYTTGSGKHAHTHKQSVALLESDDLKIPAFSMQPENMFHKLTSVFGSQDIDFETHPEFSKMYLLRSDDESAVRDFFDDSILKYFESKKRVCVEAFPTKMIMYFAGKKSKPEQLKSLFEDALDIYGRFVERIGQMG